MDDKYGTCTAYCQAVGRKCVGAWEENRNTCIVESTEDCNNNFGAYTNDAICQCGDIKGDILSLMGVDGGARGVGQRRIRGDSIVNTGDINNQ